ncbi:MAG: gamma-glutamyltransferase family protein [Alphaproteobacteria bacterium]|nr:gamma-glutamyltransferase family protein [Alphaproteobacteria bacterium]
MIWTTRARRGAVVASHNLAAEAGLAVLREGGNAIEAMVAAVATISVVYPHMNGIGGDGFWLIDDGNGPPRGIMGIGRAGERVTIDHYRELGLEAIPSRGPQAAITAAGTVSSWQAALDISRTWDGRLPLTRLLADAAYYARHGFPVSRSQHENTAAKRDELADVPGFADLFLPGGTVPDVGELFRNTALAETLDRLAAAGLEDFYRGDIARAIAADLERAGSLLTLDDIEGHRVTAAAPLSVALTGATIYNLPPPTQGLASLMILALFDRFDCTAADNFEHVHLLVEATKQAFRVRDDEITDPAFAVTDPVGHLSDEALARAAGGIDPAHAAPWPQPANPGDTVWLGAIDEQGRAVSFIHSIYWEFGAGVVLPQTGITWQNRGVSFALDEAAPNPLTPGRQPFHTNNPALARLDDGRVMVYGTMGGDGQPQTQAAVFSRYARFGQGLQQAVSGPRWLLGRRWSETTTALRLENRFDPAVLDALRTAGHEVVVTEAFDEIMGHAGALVCHASGTIEGANDPRGDGAVAGY